MKKKEIFHLFVIIIAILFISILIGDILITPIVLKHKFLVRFFGFFFLFLTLFLLSMKIYSNYQYLVTYQTDSANITTLLKKTIIETAKQLFIKTGNFLLFLAFFIVIGGLTIYVIWLNGKLVKIQGV